MPERVDPTDCSVNPCDLCKEREKYADIFVAVTLDGLSDVPPGTSLDAYVCGHCIPTHSPALDMESDNTQVWSLDSYGWLGPISCMDCGEDIPVELVEEVTEVIPDMDERVRALHEADNG